MSPEQVTVIIPTHNCARFVCEAIDSALAQTITPAQIIVIDDGSTDDTASRLRAHEPRITVISQSKQGTAAARNTGLRMATGDFIAFLDADDVWHARKLDLQLQAFRNNPSIGMLGTQTTDYPNEPFAAIHADGLIEEIPLQHLLVRNYLATSSVMIRRTVIQQVGDFDATIPSVEDLDYWQRAGAIAPVASLCLPLTGYRHVPGSVSNRAIGVEVGLRRILHKLDDRNAWKGRPLLRRKAISQMHYSVAYLQGLAGRQSTALWRMIQSFAWYPLPYARRESGTTLGRPKRAAAQLLRLMRLMTPETGLINGGPPNDA